MRKTKLKRFLLLIGVLILIGVIYLNTNFYIEKQQWKHSDGVSVGDWIEFDNVFYKIEGRTILKKNEAVGNVVFCLGKTLIIKEYKSGNLGHYVNKSGFGY